MEHKIGIVVEGGGMRGVFAAGVLDALLDRDVRASYIIGVSAGACHASSYVSGQKGRSFRTCVDYVGDPRYLSLHNYRTTGSLFGMDFVFHEIPDKLDPYDYGAMQNSPVRFCIGVTDLLTGRPAYFEKEDLYPGSQLLAASCALPIFSQPVEFRNRLYLDGGTSDPIPIGRALQDGCDRLIVVITRERGYRKKPESPRGAYRYVYRHYPEMIRTLEQRHIVYRREQEMADRLEKEGTAVVIAPTSPVPVSRFTKDRQELTALYESGYQAGKAAVIPF
ncbi:MAG: patatin family protein [Clostridia bacterium]|nr:patatin family protein [Clostridia bacterium]MDD7482849.1 patatin family protein [Clostridia bacterium]MDY5558140.1 patatin family protein [Candidatus Heritagella sp.]